MCVDCVLRNTQAYTPAIEAGQWRWFTGQQSYGAYLAGYTGGLRVTIGSTLRYDGSFTPPVSVFQTYAPAPGSTLSGRVLLGTNGAVVQSGNNPLNVKTGILQTLISKIFSMEDINASNISNILSTTDQFTFTASGVVADAGTTGGSGTVDLSPIASAISTVDGKVTAIKAQTDQVNFKTISVTEYTGDQYWVNVSLLLHMNGSDLSTIFTDEAGHTVSVYGDAKITTSNSKYGGSSGTFDGSGDYVGVTADSSLNLVSGDWTIETWIYIPALPSSNMYIYDKDGVSGSSYPQYSSSITAAGKISTFLGNGNGVSPSGQGFLSNGTISINTWTHLAWVRSGNNLILFIDGIQDYLATITATMYEGNKPFYIGFSTGQPSTSNLKGLIDDFRITKGVARYISNFTPPSEELAGAGTNNTYDQTRVIAYGTGGTGGACDLTVVEAGIAGISSSLTTVRSNVTAVKAKTDQLAFTVNGVVADSGTTVGTDYTSRFDTIDGEVLAIKTQTDKLNFTPNSVSVDPILDPYFSDVILLMDNEGDNNSTVFTDLTTIATLSNAGTPKLSTSFKKFGVSSAYFDGASRVDASVINMSTYSHWTVDMWVYMPATVAGGVQTLIGSWNGASTLSWHIGLSKTGVPFIEVSKSGVYEASNSVMASSAITLAEWHMITMTKNGSIYKLYVDGVAVITLSGPASIYNSGAGINIGARNDLSMPFTGYIDSTRITKNVVRQVLNFTVPTTDFPGTTSVSPELSYYVSTNATGGGGGDCNLAPVTNSLATLSNDVGIVGSNVLAVKAKTDQLAFTSGSVNSHPDNSATVASISTNLGTANSNITAIKDQTDQLAFDLVSATKYLGGDPSWANVSLLLHGNGTDRSTNIIDETGKIVS